MFVVSVSLHVVVLDVEAEVEMVAVVLALEVISVVEGEAFVEIVAESFWGSPFGTPYLSLLFLVSG